MLPRHELADHLAGHRSAAQAAAGPHLETGFAGVVVDHLDADVVHTDQRRIGVRHRVHRDLELARQVGEFRVEGGPLTDDLAPGARILDFLGVHAGVFVGGDVADAVTAGLDGVHLHARQFRQDIRHVLHFRPVELDVLAGADVAEALVVFAHHLGQGAHLFAGEQAVGHRNTQHRRVTLNIEAVLQPQHQELVLAELAGQIAPGLVAVLSYPLFQKPLVIVLIYVHDAVAPCLIR